MPKAAAELLVMDVMDMTLASNLQQGIQSSLELYQMDVPDPINTFVTVLEKNVADLLANNREWCQKLQNSKLTSMS